MKRTLSRLAATLVAVFIAVIPAAVTDPARAGGIDQVIGLMQTIDSAAPGALPFNAADMAAWEPVIAQCTSGDGNDVLACVDTFSKSKAGQEADIPSWLPQMIDVYFDLRDKDYWGLVEDAGQAVACAVAEGFTGGFDVCGAIAELVDTAKTVYSSAEAVLDFLGSLGGDIGSVGKDLYCGIFGCDDGPPPDPPAVVAFKTFLYPRVQQGLDKRLSGAEVDWTNWAGLTPADKTAILVQETPKGQGFGPSDVVTAMPGYWNAVYTLWDSRILGDNSHAGLVTAVKQAAQPWATPQAVQAQLSVAQNAFDPATWDWQTLGPPGKYNWPPQQWACDNDLAAKGGAAVDTWMLDRATRGQNGIPPLNGSLSGSSWPSEGYRAMCTAYRNAFRAGIGPRLMVVTGTWVHKACSAKAAGPGQKVDPAMLSCDSDDSARVCKGWAQASGQNITCAYHTEPSVPIGSNPAAGKPVKYHCTPPGTPPFDKVFLWGLQTIPPYCHLADQLGGGNGKGMQGQSQGSATPYDAR